MSDVIKDCNNCAWYSHISWMGCVNPEECEDKSAWTPKEDEEDEDEGSDQKC